MVGNINSTNNFSSMNSSTFQEHGDGPQGPKGFGRPDVSDNSGEAPQDSLGVFSTVDSDSDNTISESEFNTLTEGILEVTGNQLTSSFIEFDTDGDNLLNVAELGSVLADAGFLPPPPPEQGMPPHESQGEAFLADQTGGQDMMIQLIGYLDPQPGDLDVTI